MSILKAHIDKAITEIVFNGCKIPTRILELYFETACEMARLEGSQELTSKIFGSHITEPNEVDQNIIGHWGNDIPNK